MKHENKAQELSYEYVKTIGHRDTILNKQGKFCTYIHKLYSMEHDNHYKLNLMYNGVFLLDFELFNEPYTPYDDINSLFVHSFKVHALRIKELKNDLRTSLNSLES